MTDRRTSSLVRIGVIVIVLELVAVIWLLEQWLCLLLELARIMLKLCQWI